MQHDRRLHAPLDHGACGFRCLRGTASGTPYRPNSRQVKRGAQFLGSTPVERCRPGTVSLQSTQIDAEGGGDPHGVRRRRQRPSGRDRYMGAVPDKHVFVVDGFRTHSMLRAPLNGPYVSCGRPGTPPGHQCAGILQAAHCADRLAAAVRDPVTRQVRAVMHFLLDAALEPPSGGPSNVPSPRSPSDPISAPAP